MANLYNKLVVYNCLL